MSTVTPTSSYSTRPSNDPAKSSLSSARVSFRQPVSTIGHIDGAWWPRSLDLTAEVPALLEMLWTAARDINRLTYNLASWDWTPRRVMIEGHVVRLGGFVTSNPLTVRLTDAWGRERIDLLVLAPDTPAAVAQEAMQLASSSDSVYTAAQILDLAGSRGGESNQPAR